MRAAGAVEPASSRLSLQDIKIGINTMMMIRIANRAVLPGCDF
jgi:hypothetical protein